MGAVCCQGVAAVAADQDGGSTAMRRHSLASGLVGEPGMAQDVGHACDRGAGPSPTSFLDRCMWSVKHSILADRRAQ